MIARFLPANPTLAHRFGNLLYWLFDGMAQDWQRRGVTHVHAMEISLRVHGLWKRVHGVLEQWRAGTLRAPRQKSTSPRPSPQSGEGAVPAASAQRIVPGWSVLPRGFGWLRRLFSAESIYHLNAFYPLLHDDAEMQAVIAAAPQQIGRVLRPFCHLLGMAVPAALRLPKRRRVRKKNTSPRPTGSSPVAMPHSPHSGEGVCGGEAEQMIVPNRRLPPREQAEDAVRRSEASGKPIALKKFKPAAFGYWAHPPRDGNCPPPEIGYGGRLRPLPKDYKPPKDGD